MTEQWPTGSPTTPEVLANAAPPQRGRGRGLAIGAAAVVGGLALGVVGISAASGTPQRSELRAAAQAQATTPAPAPSTGTPPAPGRMGAPGEGYRGRGGPGFEGPGMGEHGKGGHMGGMRGMAGDALHGEFVTAKPGGGYQTVQVQRGTATAVSATSITVKSEDGFSRTYAVTKDTLVNAAKDGITTIAINDLVHVRALGAGDKAVASDVMDMTKMMANRDKFAPPEMKKSADVTPSAT